LSSGKKDDEDKDLFPEGTRETIVLIFRRIDSIAVTIGQSTLS